MSDFIGKILNIILDKKGLAATLSVVIISAILGLTISINHKVNELSYATFALHERLYALEQSHDRLLERLRDQAAYIASREKGRSGQTSAYTNQSDARRHGHSPFVADLPGKKSRRSAIEPNKARRIFQIRLKDGYLAPSNHDFSGDLKAQLEALEKYRVDFINKYLYTFSSDFEVVEILKSDPSYKAFLKQKKLDHIKSYPPKKYIFSEPYRHMGDSYEDDLQDILDDIEKNE